MKAKMLNMIGMTGVASALLLTATPAMAASWERTVTITGPHGNTSTLTTDRDCGRRGCTVDFTFTGPDGNTVESTRSFPRRHHPRR